MKNLLFILSLIISQLTFGQTPNSSWELGIFGGESYYLGELNQNHFTPVNVAFGPFVRYNYDERISIKGGVVIGKIEGDDSKSSNSFQNDRNFYFTSQLIETSILGEFNFFSFSPFDKNSYIATPYFYLGGAYTFHNPKALFNGIQIGTASLESEGNSYGKHIFVLPMGAGIKLRMGRFGFGIDWGIRKTYTDYLDDVSTNFSATDISSNSSRASISNTTPYDNVANKKRGNKYDNDWYVFTGLSLFVNLTPKQVCRTF